MFRFIRNVIVLCFILILPLLAKLYYAEPAEREYYISYIKQLVTTGEFKRIIKETPNAITQLAEKVITYLPESETFQAIAACGKTETLDIDRSSKAKIYRWVDDEGKTHYGDAAPGQNRNTEDLSVYYKDRIRYFNLDIIEDTSSLPAFTRDKISADVRQIYGILARELQLDHLRRVMLTLRIIESPEEFQAYKSRIAPGLRTNSGFYSSKTNEAVVFQGDHPASMRAVIRHESSHVIMAGLYGYTPTWFNEGMAEFFEALQVEGQARKVEPSRAHLQHLRSLLERGALPNLASYLNISSRNWYAGNLQDNYAIAWSMAFFLMSHDEGQQMLRAMMGHMSTNYCSVLATGNNFDAHYPGGLIAFESAWVDWLKGSNIVAQRF